MTIQNYIDQLNTRYKTGRSTEHTYRGDLQTLLTELCDNILVTNEPTRSACGAPDYILTRRNIPIGYIEAKDIGADLKDKKYKEQFDRYKASLHNLIFTNYLDFQLYVDGEFKYSISIGHVENGKIVGDASKYDEFSALINEFTAYTGQTIKGSKKLAKMMAGKARLLADIIMKSVQADENNILSAADNTLKEQMNAFKDVLIHDITPKDFSDIYAQTIAYGMFAARLHDHTLESFSRQEAAELIPKSNPFLRKLFQYIAGYDLDDRIKWLVDALADIFRATDVAALLKDFGKATQQNDPMIHFYETFLGEYDPKLRKSRGVWYTPEPVVNFIVRAVDDILKTEFWLKDGLADTSKTKIVVDSQVPDLRSKTGRKKAEHEVHKVQILDPACGTGTFLAEVIKQVYNKFEGQQGIWSKYVEKDLIPRLNGFEILMASYAMAHLKLDLLLKESGYKPTIDQRLRVYLTNSLEEHHPDTGTLFANWLSTEANEANHIKRDTPVMCVIGNPPYSISSSNKGIWIQELIRDYKKDLNERKINIDDDYIKFIRYGQHYIDKNGNGILAYISNNSFLDGITHRQMRKSLLESFDKIYILNLHGSSRIVETPPPGDIDQNVFDIMQGVSINIFLKKGHKKENRLANLYHTELYGSRDFKYKSLSELDFNNIQWKELQLDDKYYFFVPKDFSLEKEYNTGFKINDFFPNSNTGIQTKCDELSIHFRNDDLLKVVENFKNYEIEELKNIYPNKKDSSGWNFKAAKSDLIENKINFTKILYRPFDIRYTLYTGKSSGFIGRPRTSTMQHLIKPDNIGLITLRINGENNEFVSLITNHIIEKGSLPRGNYSVFPLYLYHSSNQQKSINQTSEREPNLNLKIVKQFSKNIGLTFISEKEKTDNTYAPIDILNYIYAILYSPTYREKYKEFLKIDFPRIPYPKNKKTFWKFVELGSQLREIHLLESPVVDQFITNYPIDGDNEVTRKLTAKSPGYEPTSKTKGRVWINDQQYFDNVPLVAWEFFIGGYQPAQKWLKDRRGRKLDYDDIRHYQRVIVAMKETERLMKEIDKISFE